MRKKKGGSQHRRVSPMGNWGSFLLGNPRKWYSAHLRVARPKCKKTGACIYQISLVILEKLFPRCELPDIAGLSSGGPHMPLQPEKSYRDFPKLMEGVQ